MGQDNEFNVRAVRGKGIQIIPLSTPKDRFYWLSIGATLGLSASNVAYGLTHSLTKGVSISAGILVVNMLFQISHLIRTHRRMKAMLKATHMTEKQLLAMLEKTIEEGMEQLEALKREAAKEDGAGKD